MSTQELYTIFLICMVIFILAALGALIENWHAIKAFVHRSIKLSRRKMVRRNYYKTTGRILMHTAKH